jgi:hypothetical protein
MLGNRELRAAARVENAFEVTGLCRQERIGGAPHEIVERGLTLLWLIEKLAHAACAAVVVGILTAVDHAACTFTAEDQVVQADRASRRRASRRRASRPSVAITA